MYWGHSVYNPVSNYKIILEMATHDGIHVGKARAPVTGTQPCYPKSLKDRNQSSNSTGHRLEPVNTVGLNGLKPHVHNKEPTSPLSTIAPKSTEEAPNKKT